MAVPSVVVTEPPELLLVIRAPSPVNAVTPPPPTALMVSPLIVIVVPSGLTHPFWAVVAVGQDADGFCATNGSARKIDKSASFI
jgi:hypothetical protein